MIVMTKHAQTTITLAGENDKTKTKCKRALKMHQKVKSDDRNSKKCKMDEDFRAACSHNSSNHAHLITSTVSAVGGNQRFV